MMKMADGCKDLRLPGSIRAVVPHPKGGRVITSGFPGLETDVMGEACFDPASCRDTLEGIKKLGADHLVILIEQEELDALGFDLLKVTAGEVGIELLFRPITDYAAPNAELIEWWDATTDWRANLFNTQGALAFACQYGAGRSGTMAALCLIEQGATATDAIARVRQEFSEAIESEAQENWLHEVGQGNAAG